MTAPGKSPRRWLFTAGIIVAAVVAIITCFSQAEPRYEGRRLSEWLADLDDSLAYPTIGSEESSKTKAVRNALQQIGTNALPWLVKDAINHQSIFERAGRSLARKQSVIKISLPPIDQRSRRAVRAFEFLGPAATPAIPQLLPHLAKNPGYAPIALAAIGSNAMPALLTALQSTNIYVLDNTAVGIANSVYSHRISAEFASQAVPSFIRMLGHPHLNVQCHGAIALAALGPWAKDAVPALVIASTNANAALQREAGPAAHSSALVLKIKPALQSPNPGERSIAVSSLAQMNTLGKDVIPLLVNCLTDVHEVVRMGAVGGLGNMTNDSAQAVPPLIPMLDDPSPIVRLSVANSLRYHGTNALTAVPALEKALEDADEGVRGNVRLALTVIHATAEKRLRKKASKR